jgi:diaminohydroxyphosphoribosylaminopyrimidine deaminase/5-amino-6-(5-phosphoribosylamino)uracil reductase
MARFVDPHTIGFEPRADLRLALDGLEPHLVPLYAPLIAPLDGSNFVFGQVGQSLDGRVATRAGDAKAISGPAGIQHLHRLRALTDAVIVGVGTVLHDDPRLTVRDCAGVSPARVIVDPQGRAPDEARVFTEDGARRLVIQCTDTPRPRGIEIIRISAQDGRVDPFEIIAALAAAGLPRIMVEGGANTLSHFLLAGALNRLLITVSPLIIGDGPAGLAFPGVPNLCDCLRPETHFYDLGGDLVIDCALQGQGAGDANRS